MPTGSPEAGRRHGPTQSQHAPGGAHQHPAALDTGACSGPAGIGGGGATAAPAREGSAAASWGPLRVPSNLSFSNPPKAEARGEVVGGGLLGSRQRTFAVLCFAACSSTMLVFNKLAVQQIRLPSSLISFQMLSAVAVLRIVEQLGAISIQQLSWEELQSFALPVFTFTGSVFCNVNGLQYSNVETFIVFRCSTPIVASLIEGLCMDRELPSLRSWVAMGMVLTGAVAFVVNNGTFRVASHLWVVVWYCFTVADALVLRSFMQSVELSLWSRTYWYNTLALPFFLAAMLWNEEYKRLPEIRFSPLTVGALTASTIVGFFIAYTGFMLRSVTSAASFLVVATVCKVITIALSIVIWRQIGSVLGLAGLMQCILGGALYVEAPARDGERQRRVTATSSVESQPRDALLRTAQHERVDSSG